MIKSKFAFTTALFVSVILSSVTAQAVQLASYESGQPSTHCREKWTKRGVLDSRMYNYCMGRQLEGYADLKNLISKYSHQKWIQDAVNHSFNKWTNRSVTQWHMVHHELEKITEAHEDILYEMKQPNWNRSRFEFCSKKWGIQLYMVTYCYKNE